MTGGVDQINFDYEVQGAYTIQPVVQPVDNWLYKMLHHVNTLVHFCNSACRFSSPLLCLVPHFPFPYFHRPLCNVYKIKKKIKNVSEIDKPAVVF